ncbi:MAG: hypothetical protein PSX36_14150 [bacterium]|nr:hypothetical protein [bacterium]
MTTRIKILTCLLITIIYTSCKLQKGHLKILGKQDDIIATDSIKKFMKTKERPSIVLRVPNDAARATESENNNSAYSAIERELMAYNFNVKDRGLFNAVIGGAGSLNYEQLSKLTDVDLILEVVYINDRVPINTNRVFDVDGYPIASEHNFTRYGATIELKLILVKSNDFAGGFLFNYTPCKEKNNDCHCKVGYKGKKVYSDIEINFCGGDNKIKTYEFVPINELEALARRGVQQMMLEIKE